MSEDRHTDIQEHTECGHVIKNCIMHIHMAAEAIKAVQLTGFLNHLLTAKECRKSGVL